MVTQFEIRKSATSETRLLDAPARPLEPGQVRLALRQFALTANNVTYAQAADLFGYWQFFPSSEADWGLMPVWGFGEMIEGDALPHGQLVYGYFPPASELIVSPSALKGGQFVDTSAHRTDLPKVYNTYRLAEALEPKTPLFEPLLVTSWALAGHSALNEYFGAEQVLILSASGKTSLGLGHALKQTPDSPRAIGLTSPANKAFTTSCEVYDEVLSYEELAHISAHPTLIIDMSGNAGLIGNLQKHLGDNLRHVVKVGLSHWDQSKGLGRLEVASDETFFAPAYLAHYAKAHGPEALQIAIAAFLKTAYAASDSWLTLKHLTSLEALPDAYEKLRGGRQSPAEGLIFTL